MTKNPNYRFFLGGADLEMVAIRELLQRHAPGRVVDKGLAWGASVGDYLAEIKPGLAVPPPFVPEIDVDRRTLRLRLTLFGAADICRDAVRQALLRAAQHGIALAEHSRYRPALDILDGCWWRHESALLPALPGQVQLKLVTPLALSASGPVKADPQNLIFALLDRISGLARWQGIRLDTDWSGWRDLAKSLDFEGTELGPSEFKRHSSRQPGRLIPMRGLIGKIVINRPPARLMPLLALGQTAHAGAHGAFGMGRYELIAFP